VRTTKPPRRRPNRRDHPTRQGGRPATWRAILKNGDNEMAMLLDNRVAVVTGAGRGIGFGIALRFAHEGATVVIGELVEDLGREAAERILRVGGRAEAIRLDVADGSSCREMVETILERHDRIDVLVNNAGVFRLHPSEDMPEEDWRLQIDVMLTGTFLCTQAVGRAMIKQGGGSVVSIASIGGMGGWPMRSAYNAAKAGVIVLTEVLATEWAHHGVRVNCVSPGVTRTEMLDVAVRQRAASLEAYEARTPLGRVAEVEEIASAVLFLASERAGHITGQNLRVDGGWVPWANPLGVGFPQQRGDSSPQT
jgi:NAD(P)-dependent dehydrogenase (short-subunit alcohol dehydrogenase family)